RQPDRTSAPPLSSCSLPSLCRRVVQNPADLLLECSGARLAAHPARFLGRLVRGIPGGCHFGLDLVARDAGHGAFQSIGNVVCDGVAGLGYLDEERIAASGDALAQLGEAVIGVGYLERLVRSTGQHAGAPAEKHPERTGEDPNQSTDDATDCGARTQLRV